MVHDSYVRGDLGERSASEILGSFKDQLGNFAAHPDIRNLPILGTGATATAARMQKQYDAGNYSGMIGTAAGFLGQFAAPNLHQNSSRRREVTETHRGCGDDGCGQSARRASTIPSQPFPPQ